MITAIAAGLSLLSLQPELSQYGNQLQNEDPKCHFIHLSMHHDTRSMEPDPPPGFTDKHNASSTSDSCDANSIVAGPQRV